MRSVLRLIRRLHSNRWLIWQLALHDLRSRYAATLVGSLWAVINPVMVILVFWFVSAYGLKITLESGPPLFLVIFCGLVPWMTFSEAVSNGAGAVLSHAYLVRKIAFPLEILPIVHIVSAVIVHGFLVGVLIVILRVSGAPVTLRYFQAAYYFGAMLAFATGLAWLLSALNVFNRDVGTALSSIMTIWFWATPIIWPAQDSGGLAMRILRLNPLYFVVEGYRNAFLYAKPLIALWPLDVFFWGLTGATLAVGGIVFRRLKPHFADVL